MNFSQALERLFELEKEQLEVDRRQIEISKERTNLLNLVRKEITATKKVNVEGENLFKFTTNIAAFKHILAQHPEGLHVDSLVEELKSFGIFAEKSTVSGVLRRYSADGRTFEALGGNRFKLKDQLLPKK